MLRNLLIPFSWIYYGITSFRNFLYDSKILKSNEYDIPVISIGNITVGGTGKTPHTEFVVNLLKDMFKITILSRGYKRKTKGYVKATQNSTVAEIGDEPKQMSRKFWGTADMCVCENRADGIAEILKEGNDNQLIILDDAYQHRKVHPRVNILLVDYNRPVFEDHLLPWGNLRESAKECARANIVIITKCPDDMKPIDRRVMSKYVDLLPSQSIYFTNFKYQPLRPVFGGEGQRNGEVFPQPEINNDTEILLITGIANTKVLREHVESLYSKHITHLEYKDHYNFGKGDLEDMEEAFAKLPDNRVVITTEKDAMRLDELGFSEMMRRAMYYLPIEVNFVFDDQDNLKTQLLKYVAEDKGNYRLHTTVRQF